MPMLAALIRDLELWRLLQPDYLPQQIVYRAKAAINAKYRRKRFGHRAGLPALNSLKTTTSIGIYYRVANSAYR